MKITNEQFLRVVSDAHQLYSRHPELRIGQALFNSLFDKHPEIAREIVETEADPFYVDGRIKNFVNYLL